MGLIATVRAWLGLSESVALPPSGMIDPDDYLYRPLTARVAGAGLPVWQQDKQLALARHLDRGNPAARRILDLLRDFVFGEGVTLAYQNDQVEAILDAHWHDPLNRWDSRGPRWFRTLLRDGELLAVVAVNPVNGFVRWGSISPERIKQVKSDPNNWEVVRQITLKPEKPGEPDRVLTAITVDLASGAMDGEAMLFRLNDDGGRGISYLYPLADLLDALDQAIFNDVERAALLKAFVWDVTVQNATPDQLNLMVATDPQFQPPKPASVRAHNENITWNAVTPGLNAGDGVLFNTFLLTYTLGGAGIPLHWFGFGGDANRATAGEMDEPVIKFLTRLQDQWREHLTDLLRFVVDQAIAHNQLPATVARQDGEGKDTGEQLDARDAFAVVMPDMNTTDIAQVAAALQQVAAALLTMTGEHWVSAETAQQTAWGLLAHLGQEIDPTVEQARIKAQQAQDAERQQLDQARQQQLLSLVRPNGTEPARQPTGQP